MTLYIPRRPKDFLFVSVPVLLGLHPLGEGDQGSLGERGGKRANRGDIQALQAYLQGK